MGIREFDTFKEATDYAWEIYAAVYFDPNPPTLDRPGTYLVPETTEEKEAVEERGLELATGWEYFFHVVTSRSVFRPTPP